MTEHSQELIWSQMVDEGGYSDAEKVAAATLDLTTEAQFTDITEEVLKTCRDLTLALLAATDFLNSPDQPSSLAESILADIDQLQDVLSQTTGIEPRTARRIAEITPKLEAIALQRLD